MRKTQRGATRAAMIVTIVAVAAAVAVVTALLVNIIQRKSESRNPYVRSYTTSSRVSARQ